MTSLHGHEFAIRSISTADREPHTDSYTRKSVFNHMRAFYNQRHFPRTFHQVTGPSRGDYQRIFALEGTPKT